jgi:hypothetical protein
VQRDEEIVVLKARIAELEERENSFRMLCWELIPVVKYKISNDLVDRLREIAVGKMVL